MLYYGKTAEHRRNVEVFKRVMDRADLRTYAPNERSSPWHRQVALACDDGTILYIDFWPHLIKGYSAEASRKVAVGEDALLSLIEAVFSEQHRRKRPNGGELNQVAEGESE